MDLPIGATEEILERCKKIMSVLTERQDTTELSLKILNLIYAKGGDYSEETLHVFAETYLKSIK